ncbi:hypothetical protein CA12_02370 [Alienimonas californiensis]|uniref:Tc1-like transposase DDE domain-containing protein n=1 Tax=Alienimonas californiensis TaxID=2527989 RepID=A0A517P473_9PLAN|nr:hypothetical protein CA12_02370 [Alienimonas californiensis]
MIPPKQSGGFVCRMEEVLAIYQRPYDARFPVVCLDETNTQLVSETRTPLSVRPGEPARYDHEDRREGVAQLFLAFEPLTNRRWTWVRPHKAAVDFAEVVRELADRFPEAARILLVSDNLNTHGGGSFYTRFPPAEARRLCERIQFVHTPSTARGSIWPRSS